MSGLPRWDGFMLMPLFVKANLVAGKTLIKLVDLCGESLDTAPVVQQFICLFQEDLCPRLFANCSLLLPLRSRSAVLCICNGTRFSNVLFWPPRWGCCMNSPSSWPH